MFKSSELKEGFLLPTYSIDWLADPLFCVDSNARFLYLNNAACCQFEYTRQELLTMKLSSIDPNFLWSKWSKQWQSLSQQGNLVTEFQYRTKSGKLLSVDLTFTYVKETNREFGCALMSLPEKIESDRKLNLPDSNGSTDSLYQEIAQLKETEAQLEKNLSLVRGTLDSTAFGTIAVSSQGEVLSYNQKFVEMWNIPDSLALGKSDECQDFFNRQLKNPEVFYPSVWQVSRESETETYDILELKDGRVFAQCSKPQRLDDKIIGRVWSIMDITELKQQNKSEIPQNQGKIEINRAIEKAKELSELRSRFLSTLCHQFRSSLNIISFSNSLLKRYANKWNDDKKLPYIDKIQTAVKQITNQLDELSAVERITNQLDELLFFGRSEVGQIEFSPKPIDLDLFCSVLARQIQPLSESKQQTIEFINSSSCKDTCIDENILRHVLINLLSNSIKYSPNGSKIEVRAICESERIIIKVKDRGIGISAIDRQRLFEPFFRGSNIDNIAGNGLGLSIVKNLVEIHQGAIEVESKLDLGTTFTLTLPVTSLKSE